MSFWEFVVAKQSNLTEMLVEHLEMVGISLAISIVLGLLIGIAISHYEKAAKPVLYLVSAFLTIPCFALFAFLLPIMGLNRGPVILGLVIYTLLPIVRNVYVGIKGVDRSLTDVSRGMGMRPLGVLLKVQLPLASPMIVAGIRTAVALGIGVGAIAAYIGAGGLGEYIFQGISRGNLQMILSASLLLALMTIVFDVVLRLLQRACYRRVS